MTLGDAAILIPLYTAALVGLVNAVGAHWGRKDQKKEAESVKQEAAQAAAMVKDALIERAQGIDTQLKTIHESTNGGLASLRTDLDCANAEIKRLHATIDRRTALLLKNRPQARKRR